MTWCNTHSSIVKCAADIMASSASSILSKHHRKKIFGYLETKSDKNFLVLSSNLIEVYIVEEPMKRPTTCANIASKFKYLTFFDDIWTWFIF